MRKLNTCSKKNVNAIAFNNYNLIDNFNKKTRTEHELYSNFGFIKFLI